MSRSWITPLFALMVVAGGISACGPRAERAEDLPASSAPPAEKAADATPLVDEIPTDQLQEVLKAHFEGIGQMEQLSPEGYSRAVAAFREVHRRAPGWIPGSINLAIALMNSTGAVEEQEKEAVGRGPEAKPKASNFDEALGLLDGVLKRQPENLHAHYCRGVILRYIGRTAEAHQEFLTVTRMDPTDGHAWYNLGSTLGGAAGPSAEAILKQAKDEIPLYQKALECNPYLVSAMYNLQLAYGRDGRRDRQKELIALWQRLNPSQNAVGTGDLASMSYDEMGRYAQVIDWTGRIRPADAPFSPPRFEVPARLSVALPEGHRWSAARDFDGDQAVVGRIRDRFGAALAALDLDGDTRLDLFLAGGAVGPDGARDVLLRNRGDGTFEDVSAAWKLPAGRVSLGVAAGDFDADGRPDLFLTGIGDNRLLRNLGDRFEDVTAAARLGDSGAISLTARWLDLDQDGDLDLYVVNSAPADQAQAAFTDDPAPGHVNAAYRNDGQPPPVAGRPPENWAPLAVAPNPSDAKAGLSIAFTPWPSEGSEALGGGAAPHTAVACLDLDDDRDLDLVITADGQPPLAALNDRLGRFHSVELPDLKGHEPISGLLVTDLDRDTRPDLAAIPVRGKVALWRNRTVASEQPAPPGFAFEFWATDAHDWRAGEAVDLDLDGAPDLLGLPSTEPAPEWARNAGNNLKGGRLALGPGSTAPLAGLACVNLSGDPLPDLVLLRDGEGPELAQSLGNGHHWLALSFAGRWRFGKGAEGGPMRTNSEGLGTRVLIQGPGLNVSYVHTTGSAGLAQSSAPVVLGLGRASEAALIRLTWPDHVMQSELNQEADGLIVLVENNRKTGSCPVLFTWDGERFVCIGDFLGGGGLGYLVAPGVYSDPDRDEAVAIATDQLRPVDGVYRLSITEPMDEVAYLDRLALEVVDRPPGIEAAPDERFAPGGNRPSGKLITWRTAIEPRRATDLSGRDLTATLRHRDRRTADGFRRLGGWIGYAEEHGIVLDFDDRLSGYGPDDRLVLCLAGWVEYPYSQTNYAAATAGVALRAPVLERLREDGTWEVLEPDPGYPAGLPRLTTLELTGRLGGPRCVLRLRTNMECYWDQAFVARAEDVPDLRTTELTVSRAALGGRGYTREVSPDGRLPLLYDYDYVDPAPLARLRGKLTRPGDVAELLRGDDDHLCVMGPGDEVRLEFDARSLPPLESGWTRSYVLRSVGYCKDADPFTAASDTVGPLPWNGMAAYPFGPEGERPRDPSYDAYLRRYQTRAVGEPRALQSR
jgi:tetratricopeptide (TPR) repeat protein